MGVAHPVFGIIYKYRVLGLDINDNRICCQSWAEDPDNEGTLPVTIDLNDTSFILSLWVEFLEILQINKTSLAASLL